MKQISKNGIIKCHLNNSKNLAGLTFFLFFFAIISNVHAQEETKAMSFGIHAGVNFWGSNFKPGSSFALHGAYSIFDNPMQLELMLFYNNRPDAADIHRDEPLAIGLKTSAYGLALGGRYNIRPYENWNPSFVFMHGLAFVKEYDRIFREKRSATLCLFFSNTLYQKHMISMGMHTYLTSESAFNPRMRFLFTLTYGFWF